MHTCRLTRASHHHHHLRGVQVFRAFDVDGSGSLELCEVMAMCRQLGGLSYNEACFVQVGVWVCGACLHGFRLPTSCCML